MADRRQLRLLLWKDYLIRKRKLITLAGIIWATAVMFSLYIVRINVNNEDFPTCGFPARALPSAGMIPFLQSFMCTINNECSPLDELDELPTYENSKLTQLQRKLAPIMNETVLDVAGTVPDAIKLLATLADVVDEPTFIDISKNGLKVKDLFTNPGRVKRFLSSKLKLNREEAHSLMDAELSFQGLLNGDMNRCNARSLNETLLIDADHLDSIAVKLCAMSAEDLQKVFIDMLFEVDYSKFMTMLGDMYYKLSKDNRITTIGDLLTAVLRMMRLQSFLPPEVLSIFNGQSVDFTYVKLDLIPRILDLFKPTFGDTDSYQTIRDFADTAIVGLQYLDKVFAKQRMNDEQKNIDNDGETDAETGLQVVSNVFHNAADVLQEAMAKDSSIDAFSILSQIMNFITKFLSAKIKHDVLFYSTLLAKLMESAYKVIDINMHIEQLTYNVTLRNPGAKEILQKLPPHIVGKAFEALADAERTQILTSKINVPGQMFCDVYKLQTFFVISKSEAESLRKQLCVDTWKNYVSDLIESFGVFEVKNNINNMASLLIQETLGKDTTDQLYSIDQDFKVFKNFTTALIRMEKEPAELLDWTKLFPLKEDDELMKVVKSKVELGKQMLIVIHGALAKEIVKQNAILNFKISPYLNDVIILVSAINKQLDMSPGKVVENVKILYPRIVETMLNTALNEKKTYKSLSTPGTDIFCNGVDIARDYLELPAGEEQELLVDTLCDATVTIENGLKADSVVSKAIYTIKTSEHPVLELNWNKLITNLRDLYVKLDRDYTYLFKFSYYGMTDEVKRDFNGILVKAKEYWFGLNNMERSLRLSIQLGLRFLDLLDFGLFDVSGEIWLRMKYAITSTVGPFTVFDDIVHLVTALITNETYVYTGDLPPTTVAALGDIIPNIPQLITDAVDIIVHGDTDVEPIISILNASPPWPCSSTSLSELLKLTPKSKYAVEGIETILCMNKEFQIDWVEYLNAKNATVKNISSWNTTDYPPHLFLMLSSIMDAFIDDVKVTKDALEYMFNDSTDGRLGMKEAWNYAVQALNTSERDVILRNMFTKIDTALNSIDTTAIPDNVPLNNLWERFTNCSTMDEDCRMIGRKAWKYFFETFSVILENIASDLLIYFKEINEPNANLLQLVGFTRNTGLYMLYEKVPEFMGVMLNSYWDFGFMSQVRRASLSQFWDCEAVVTALVPPPGSVIDEEMIKKVQPFLCPSLLHWLSLPRGENTLLDVFSKPQYYFYRFHVQNITSSYKNAYTKATELAAYLTDLSKLNKTLLTKEEMKMNSIEEKMKTVVDKVLNFKIKQDDPNYRLFSDINLKQFASNIYLARIVAIVNKLRENIDNIELGAITDDENMKSVESDLVTIKYLFTRKPIDAIAIHFDLLTDVLWNNNENYNLVNAFDSMCNNLKNKTSKTILVNYDRIINQVCAKKYKEIYGAVQDIVVIDYIDARKSLVNLVNVLRNGEDGEVHDVFEFLNGRKQLISSLRNSIKYSYDLSIPIYLKYLQSNLQSYNVVLTFLAGEDWWKSLKDVYNGPYATKFLGYLENGFEVAEDWLSKFDEIHLVRLLHDVDVNETESFCQPNITLSDYIPDSTGMLSELKRQMCEEDKTELYRELPPLVFAFQGYEMSLKLSKDVNYTALNLDIAAIESRLDLITEPKAPMVPPWVTEQKLQHLRMVALRLLSKETLTRAAFGVLSNGVDAATLFLNNSQCTVCSQFTTWFKQLNLQLYKKQEYDSLLCHLETMTLTEVYHMLKNEFHWDMAIRELISTRNYTKYEMNKSINEFLGQVKVHLLEDMAANTTKLTECLIKNVTRNELGNVTLFASVVAHTATLIRAALPHIHEVAGVKDMPYLKDLAAQVAHNLNVLRPLSEMLNEKSDLHHDLHHCIDSHDVVFYVQDGLLNLPKVQKSKAVYEYLTPSSGNWSYICANYDCKCIDEVIRRNINITSLQDNLPKLQLEEFWRFTFISNILARVEALISHGARLLGVASQVDLHGVMEGRLTALLDTVLLFINEETLDSVLYSLQGVAAELQPVGDWVLVHDVRALGAGLAVLRELKNYLLEEVNLKMEVWSMFPDGARVEAALSARGLNNTNFWSLAAPRIHAGYIQLKPLLSSKLEDSHISNYVCQMDPMSKVIEPADLGVVTAEDVYAAVIEQFCGLPDDRVKQLLPVLLGGFNFSIVFDKVADVLLTKLYAASNLTADEGATVLAKYSQMAALVPLIQENVGDVGALLGNEPMFKSLTDFSSVGGLLSSSEFLSSAGNMLCGKPFLVNTNRFYKSIASMPDMATGPDQAQLDILPTDFCRSLYQDIIKMEGGKIVWSFVKPLIMGKILYTPPSPAVTRIIEQANATFSTMIKMTNLVHSFAASFPAVDKLSAHREGVAVLRRVMTSPQFGALRGMLIGGDDVEVPAMDIDGVFDEFGDMKNIGSLLTKGSDLLHCINLNRFQPSPDEDHLIHEAGKLSVVNEFSAGVVFLNAESQDSSLSNVEYKIRMDIDNAPTTKRLKDYLWIPGPESNFIENMRYFRGFIQIQDLVEKAIIQLSHNSTRRKRDTQEKEMEWAMYTQQTPYPCYRKDYFQTSLYDSQSLIVAFFFSLLFTVASAVRFIVSDKESGNTMLMSVMGVDLRWHTLSWLLSSLAEMCVTCACVTLVLYFGRVLPSTAPTLVFVLLLIFGVSVISFCYMLSKLFNSASLGAVCTAIAYLVSFMPFIIILSLEAVLYSELKIFVCLSMSSALCYAFLYITRFEAGGAGAGWAQLWAAPDEDEDMSIALAAAMMVLDAALYALIGYLIDRYFGLKTLSTNITHCTSTDEKAGVSILNVTKIYHQGSSRAKVALDNVSIELHKGQVTTLLGHNGAGKTTLINILTGMLKPTKGHVIVRSEHSGTRLGVCPQRDVLFEYMTGEEHVMLYAQLKSGLSAQEVRGEVDKLLGVLSLGPYGGVAAARLSGGTRRRLCVALAFVGAPHLVSLDEPTAGVDPAARRDIWSMIVKLKEDRTILLTTHHLDEAELLSDQIVIMHKGQIHTTGSPIEIKRTLGNGYKLNVMYPQRAPDLDSPWEESSQEEKTKQLLTVVRDTVKNANLVDVSGLEVEVALPFFDANGTNNDFLQLCTTLEATQSALGFKSYTLDCSSLEQVFFNVCQQADTPLHGIEYVSEGSPSKSASSSSIRTERGTHSLLAPEGAVKGTAWQQFLALMHGRCLHHIRNSWLLFMLIVLPTLFVITAMAFSMLRPPIDSEVALKLDQHLYRNTTQFVVPTPSIYSNYTDPAFAESILQNLMTDAQTRNWTMDDSPTCKCTDTRHECVITQNQTLNLPEMLVLPDVKTLNNWLIDTQQIYLEKRYGGYSSVLKNNVTNLVAWYNNKGHHAMPAYLNALNSALLQTVSSTPTANITVYTHPLKISKEQISKATVYQHIADAGISGLVLVAYCLISGGAAIYLVGARKSQEKRLQLLCGVSPLLYWTVALVWDMMIIFVNMCITACVMSAFGFPVFVDRNNLPAICILILLYGFACSNLVHVAEKLFTEPSMATMVLFCGNAFLGFCFIAILLVLDIISESEATDRARSALHKVFMLAPQFALGDGLLEIAKNTIQAQVLNRFGMDTYKDPLNSSLVACHYLYLLLVGLALMLLNLAIEYDYFEILVKRFRSDRIPSRPPGELEPADVRGEAARVRAARARAGLAPLRVNTIGNINRGFVHTEGKKNSLQRVVCPESDAAQCVELSRTYNSRTALRALTLGIPPGQCTALLGQNGAGKSTTFSLLTGELRPTAGQLYLNSKPVSSTQLCTGLISYCPQSDAIDPLLTVRETLQFYCRLRGIEDQDEIISRTIEMFDLAKYVAVRAGVLSGGNKRKLCTAIAFMARTPLVLLDEPTSGMDPVSRACVSRGVRAACAARRGVLLSTHALDDARRLAARVALLRAGDLVALASLDDCLSRFGGGYVLQCRARCPRRAWQRARGRAPHARLRVLHVNTLQFLIPTKATVDEKELTTRLSDIFRLMAELQSACDVEDYTVNQSSLEQMFLSFTDKADDEDPVDVEPLPKPQVLTPHRPDDLDTVTAL